MSKIQNHAPVTFISCPKSDSQENLSLVTLTTLYICMYLHKSMPIKQDAILQDINANQVHL